MYGNKATKDISFTKGPVVSSLVKFALPVLGALILQAAYGAVDLLVVGWFGDASSISAVGTASAFMQLITFVISSLAMGITVVLGHHLGEGRGDLAGKAVGTAVVLFAIIGAVLTAALEFFAWDIAALLRVPAESLAKAVLYLRICCGGVLVIIFYNVVSAVMRGAGNANLPLLFVGVACLVNVAGDLVLTGMLGMDVAGVAIATVFAQLVSVVTSLAVLRRRNLPFRFSLKCIRINPAELRRIMHVGVPIALQETMVQVSFLVINMIVNGMGLLPSAGYGVAQKVVSVIMLVPSSIMQSLSAFVAQNIGGGREDRAVQGFRTSVVIGCSLGAFMFCAGFFGRRRVVVRLYERYWGYKAERGLFERFFSRMCPDLCAVQRYRLFQRARREHTSHGTGNNVRTARSYPAVLPYCRDARRVAYDDRLCHADNDCLRHSVFLCVHFNTATCEAAAPACVI